MGRERELAEVVDCLRSPACRLLTLTGPGGSGKTRLAAEAARALLDDGNPDLFADGIFFVPLAALESAESLVPAILQALEIPFPERGSLEERLLGSLRRKSALLVLDNMEHLVAGRGGDRGPGTDIALKILDAAPRCNLLVTSRARLGLQAEQVYPVPGLESDGAAVELFLSAARRARWGFEPAAQEREAIAQLCHLVGGMPLAILLAAAWIGTLSPAEIVAGLAHEGIDFLQADWGDVAGRQRSMCAVCDHSWRLLAAREQEVFAGLSLFRGGFTAQAAQHVVGTSLRELMSLIDKSLLQRAPGGRYEMHELLRQYGQERSAESGRAAEVRDRHAGYFATAMARWWQDLQGPRQLSALAEIEADLENLALAWDWLVEHRQIERMAQALEGLCSFYTSRWRSREGLLACRHAVDQLRELAGTDALRVMSMALAWQSAFAERSGDSAQATGLARQALDILQDPILSAVDTRAEKAFALRRLAVAGRQADIEEGKRLCQQSLALYRELGDEWQTAMTLAQLAWLDHLAGRYDVAKANFESALQVFRALDNPRGTADALAGLWAACFALGDVDQANVVAQEYLAVLGRLDKKTAMVMVDVALGMHSLRGEFDQAHALAEESLRFLRENDIVYAVPEGIRTLCDIEGDLGQYEKARRSALELLALAQASGPRQYHLGQAYFHLGANALAQGAFDEAEQQLATARRILSEIGVLATHCEITLSLAACGRGDLELGRQHLIAALPGLGRGRHFAYSLYFPAIVARLWACSGEKLRAVELWALATRYPYIARSQWAHDIIGKYIAAAAATLPREAVQAAEARGRARDLGTTIEELRAELEGAV